MVKRRTWTTKQRAALFLKYGGACHICKGAIDAQVEAWDVSHEIPLELGGADDDTNAKPAHRKCHKALTAKTDIPNIAKAKRREAASKGFKPPPAAPIKSRGFSKSEKAEKRAAGGKLPVPKRKTDIFGQVLP